MAKEIIRQDVVQVVFEVPKNPFEDTINELDDLKKTAQTSISGVEETFKGFKNIAKGVQNGFAEIKKSANVDNILKGIDTDLGKFNTKLQVAKERFNSFKDSLKNITLHPIKTTSNYLSEIKTKVSSTAKSFKSGMGQISRKLTEGQSGAKGFATALKNVGKISLAKTVNGVKSIAKTSFNGLASGLKTVASKLKDIASNVASRAYNALKKVAGISFKALSVGLATVATGAGALVTKSVQSYADYEQLIGGVETLFKGSAGEVEKYANNAYKTAGLSANAYMETVTGFSASLLQSLDGDTKKAAEYADRAISDMSDNANKMGTDMGSIQYAYQGFAKQNYTMLDNLKLGYGGTKEEMKRLIKDAAKLDKSVKANDMSYGNIVNAIHAVQVEMGIYGTTAKEASTTITGSVNSMKAAWGNLLPALIKGGDQFDQCIDNLIESIVGVEDETGKRVGGVINNIMPAVQKALSGVGRLIDELAPIIAREIPTLVTSLLPPLLSAATAIVQGLVNALPSILQSVTNAMGTVVSGMTDAIISLLDILPKLVSIGIDLITSLAEGITQALPSLIPAIADSLGRIINAFVVQIPSMIDTGIQLIQALLEGILAALPIIISEAPKIITNLVNAITTSLPRLIDAGMQLIDQIITGLITNLPAIIEAALQMINALVQGIITNLPVLINGAISLINALVQGLMDNLPLIIQAAQQLITGLCNGLIQNLPIIINSAIQLILALVNALINNIGMLLSAAIQLIIGIAQGLLNNLGIIIQAAIQIIIAIVVGLVQAIPTLLSIIPEVFGAFINAIMSINWLDVGASIIKGIWEGIKGIGSGLMSGIKSLFSGGNADLSSNGSTAGNSYAKGLTGTLNSISVTPTSDKLKTELGFNLGDIGTTTAGTYTTAMDTGLGTAVTNATSTSADITKELGSINLTNEGADTVQGLINGMNGKKAAAVASARSIANAINAEYRKIQDIHSPSRVWEKFGAYQIQGNINGIENNLPKLETAVQQAGESSMPRYSPESSTTTNNRTSYNTFSPSFTLHMNGASATDTNKRKVKRWIQEAITETFDTMGRANPQLIEV